MKVIHDDGLRKTVKSKIKCHSKSNNPTHTHDCISDNIIINL
jgi:hypothetical protein